MRLKYYIYTAGLRIKVISYGWYVLTEVKVAFVNNVWLVGGTRREAVTLQPGKEKKKKTKTFNCQTPDRISRYKPVLGMFRHLQSGNCKTFAAPVISESRDLGRLG